MAKDAKMLREMFAQVAPRYDVLNHRLSAGVDRLWRRKAVRTALANTANPAEQRVLDLCTGTGDLALAFAARGCSVVAADFCPEMLALGEQKRKKKGATLRLANLCADAQRLPFPNDCFDLATVAFGIRNVSDPLKGLCEMVRVVRPGGRVIVLEFAKPSFPLLGSLYLWYFRRVLPRLGDLFSVGSRGTRAYQYLADSVMEFPDRSAFLELMRQAAMEELDYRLLSFGIAAIYVGKVPMGIGAADAS